MSISGMSVSQVNRLLLPNRLREEMLIHLLQCAPNEGVGMLGVHSPVRTDTGIEAVAALFIPGRNIEQSHSVVFGKRVWRWGQLCTRISVDLPRHPFLM